MQTNTELLVCDCGLVHVCVELCVAPCALLLPAISDDIMLRINYETAEKDKVRAHAPLPPEPPTGWAAAPTALQGLSRVLPPPKRPL